LALAAADVSHPGHAIGAAGREPPPVRAEGQGMERSFAPREGAPQPAGAKVSQPGGTILARRGDSQAIRAEGDGEEARRPLCWPFTPSALIFWQSIRTSAKNSPRIE